MPTKRAFSGSNKSSETANKSQKTDKTPNAAASSRKSLQEVDTGDQKIKAKDRDTPFAELEHCIENNPPQNRDGEAIVLYMSHTIACVYNTLTIRAPAAGCA